MNSTEMTLDEVLAIARRLHPMDQARLVARIAPVVEQVLDQEEVTTGPSPRVPMRGLLADLGPAPSAEEIDEVRHEMWTTFGAG